jgi:hypothetical protein
MPKRYRIDMTLSDDSSNTQIDKKTHFENYEDDTEAKKQFAKKEKAARETGKGSNREG